MNPEAEARLKELLTKDPNDLSDDDRAFLRARWSYIGKRSRQRLEGVINKDNEQIQESVDDPQLNHPADQADDEEEDE